MSTITDISAALSFLNEADFAFITLCLSSPNIGVVDEFQEPTAAGFWRSVYLLSRSYLISSRLSDFIRERHLQEAEKALARVA